MNFPDYYAVLGLPRFYPTREEIRDAFLQKLVELNASGDVDPNARQTLDSAYLTLSDTKKKREYDEVLDRYIEAEAVSASGKVTISMYDYTDAYTEKRSISISFLSKQIYVFLADKAQKLAEISSRYPFTSESDREENYFFEISILILYCHFFFVYREDYSIKKMLQFVDDGASLMALDYPPEEHEAVKKRLLSEFREVVDTMEKSEGMPEDEDIFDYMSVMYIFYTSNGKEVLQKIERPDFEEAFIAMKCELNNFWVKFYTEKDFVT